MRDFPQALLRSKAQNLENNQRQRARKVTHSKVAIQPRVQNRQ